MLKFSARFSVIWSMVFRLRFYASLISLSTCVGLVIHYTFGHEDWWRTSILWSKICVPTCLVKHLVLVQPPPMAYSYLGALLGHMQSRAKRYKHSREGCALDRRPWLARWPWLAGRCWGLVLQPTCSSLQLSRFPILYRAYIYKFM